jgi:membrane protease YdiL (CAAX protease family)
MTSVPPPSQPPASLHTHPELPAGVVPSEPPVAAADPERAGLGSVPWWALPAAMLAVLLVATIAGGVIAIVIDAGGGTVKSDSPGFLLPTTLVQDLALVGAAVAFASFWAPGLTPASFGFRRPALGSAVAWTVAIYATFWLATVVLVLVFGQPDAQQLTENLEEERALAAVVGYGVVVAFVAPITEEVFFRGFVFGVLREKIGPIAGAILTGLVFGLVHLPGSPLVSVAVLVVLGSLLCVLYQQTGSLLPCIALHALNNSISFAATRSLPWFEAVAIVIACTGGAVAVATAVAQRPSLFSRG